MGARGPAPKPTAVRVLEGNMGRLPLNSREPKPMAGEPEMPKHLDREARKEWKRLVPILLGMRVLTEADGIALSILCQAYSTLIQAQHVMLKQTAAAESALLMKTPSGYMQQSPLLGIINTQMDLINRQLREFGLTPASRTRIVASADPSVGGIDDSLERKLCG
jgi:P27 family predicted phage terminase small subunit